MTLASKTCNSDENEQDKIVLFTEILGKMLNPKINKKLSSVYQEVCSTMSKSNKSAKLTKFIKSNFKNILKQFLQKRASNKINIQFFYTQIDQDVEIWYEMISFLLKCILPTKKDEKQGS